MQKVEIVDSISSRTGVEKEVVASVVNSFFAEVKKSIAQKEPVFFRGFGTFEPKLRKAKTARDIGRGKTIIVPERIKPSFKPCKEFVGLVNQ